jgi:hypothetical protein
MKRENADGKFLEGDHSLSGGRSPKPVGLRGALVTPSVRPQGVGALAVRRGTHIEHEGAAGCETADIDFEAGGRN